MILAATGYFKFIAVIKFKSFTGKYTVLQSL